MLHRSLSLLYYYSLSLVAEILLIQVAVMSKAAWFLLFKMYILEYHTLLHCFPSKNQLSIILTHQTWISYVACKANNSNQQLLCKICLKVGTFRTTLATICYFVMHWSTYCDAKNKVSKCLSTSCPCHNPDLSCAIDLLPYWVDIAHWRVDPSWQDGTHWRHDDPPVLYLRLLQCAQWPVTRPLSRSPSASPRCHPPPHQHLQHSH